MTSVVWKVSSSQWGSMKIYQKMPGAATSSGHVFVYWTTSNASITSVNGFFRSSHLASKGGGCLIGDHQSDSRATKITKKAEVFESHLPPFTMKHHFEEKGYLLVSYGFQEGGCVHSDFCDEHVVASHQISCQLSRWEFCDSHHISHVYLQIITHVGPLNFGMARVHLEQIQQLQTLHKLELRSQHGLGELHHLQFQGGLLDQVNYVDPPNWMRQS